MICSLSIVSLFLLKGTLFNFTLSLHKPKTMVQLHQQASRSDLQGLPIKPIFYVKEHQSVKTIMFQLSSSSWVLCAQFLPVSLVPQESSTIILFFQPSRLCLLFFSVHFWRIMWNRLNGCSGSSNVAYYTFIWCFRNLYKFFHGFQFYIPILDPFNIQRGHPMLYLFPNSPLLQRKNIVN